MHTHYPLKTQPHNQIIPYIPLHNLLPAFPASFPRKKKLPTLTLDSMTCECVKTNITSSQNNRTVSSSNSSNSTSVRAGQGSSASNNSSSSSNRNSTNSTSSPPPPPQPIGFASLPVRPNGAGAPAALATNAQSSGPSQDRPLGPPPPFNGGSQPPPFFANRSPMPFGAAPNSLLNALNNNTGNFIPRLLNRLNSTIIPCDGNFKNSTTPANNSSTTKSPISS